MSVEFVVQMLWVYLYCYIIFACIDFGAGIYTYYALTTKDEKTISVLRRYLSPIWDGIQMVILAFIAFITSFLPSVMVDYGKTLIIQAIIIFIVLIARNLMFTLKRHRLGYNKPLTLIYGLIGLVVAATLSAVLSLSEGGYLQIWDNQVTLSAHKLFTSFYFWTVIILAIVSVFYISAMYFTFYASKLKNEAVLEKFRGHALSWCAPTLLSSALVFVALQRHNPEHFDRILDMSWIFLLSLVSFMVAISLVFMKRHYGLAFFFVLCQFFFAFFGYGASHLPFLLYPYIEIHSHLSSSFGPIIFILMFAFSIAVPTVVLQFRWLTRENR